MNDGLLGACALLAGAALFLVGRIRSGRQARPLVASVVQAAPSTNPAPRRNQLPILAAADLISRTGSAGLVEDIRVKLGFVPANFQADVLPLVQSYAEFVQLLPASESHHHAQPGGLLVHALEVASNALAIRQGYKLPRGGATEAQIAQGAAWSYAVLVAALLHDVGKPISDVVVQLFSNDLNVSTGVWNGLAGPMTEYQANVGSTHYTVTFPVSRDYSKHEGLPTALFPVLVPSGARRWLATFPDLMEGLMSYLRGGAVGSELQEIVSKADSASVASNLMSGSRTRFASARAVPMIERLMLGLRAAFAEDLVAVNRPGAGAFVDPDGQHIWAVAASCADVVRKLLQEREQTAPDGAAGIPTDNTRLFDTWAEYGALVQPPKEFGKGSVWWVKIEIDDWSHVLTVLKFPMDTVYGPGQRRPSPLAGRVIPVQPTDSRKPAPTAAASGSQSPVYEPEGDPPDHTSIEVATEISRDALASGDVDAIPHNSAPAVASPRQVAQDDEYLDPQDCARTMPGPAQPTRAVQALPPGIRTPRALFKMPGATPKPNADAFMAWLQRGLGTGEIGYNESDAVVHFVTEGMALVSPKVFKLYLESNPFIGDVGQSRDALRALQLEVQKAGYIKFNKEAKANFWWYRVKSPNATETNAVITVMLIANPQAYIRPVPASNDLLEQTQKPEKTKE